MVLDGELCRVLMGGAGVSAAAMVGIAEVRAMTVVDLMVMIREDE